MIDPELVEKINAIGEQLSRIAPEFYGKITFNFYDGKYVNCNVEQSIKIDNPKKEK